ncbi:MAG: carbohydrate porin [bacterium]
MIVALTSARLLAKAPLVKSCLTSLCCILAATLFATAQQEPSQVKAAPFLQRETLTGEWLGKRPLLSEHGVDFFATYTAEVWGNTVGGLQTGSVYTGLLDFGSDLDLEKLVGWHGAKASTTWLWLSGRDASQELVGNFLTISNIAGFDTLRLLELWLEQSLFDDHLSIRAGQITADSEFLVSDYGGLFINAEFGWTMLAGMNIPNGGAATPEGAPGVRVAFTPGESFAFLSAVYQGNVFAQDVNRHGFRWRLDAENGFTWMNEAQLYWSKAGGCKCLPGFLKAGAWFQSGQYADALANSTSSGNSGFYLLLDQMLLRENAANDPKNDQGLGFFGRTGFTPPDRNTINFFFDFGFTYKGLIPERDLDALGLAYGFAGLSPGERDSIQDSGGNAAVSEMVLEATYQCVLTPWCVLQPDAQLIVNPGGNNSVPNAFVIGARVSLVF